MTLRELVTQAGIQYDVIVSDNTEEISDSTLNSKQAANGYVFSAIRGFQTDGHVYVRSAYANGCRNFLVEYEDFPGSDTLTGITVIKVNDTRKAHGILSRLVYGCPDLRMKICGVTGTKGKTTVTTLFHHLMSHTGDISYFTTIRYKAGTESGESERTTMEADGLQKLLQKSLMCGTDTAIVEVSSHAVTLHRVENIQWDAGIFTGFSRDHLDLYGTMEKYFEAKLDFFRALGNSSKKYKFAVVNMDDPKGKDVSGVCAPHCKVLSVSTTDSEALYYVTSCSLYDYGMEIHFNGPDGDSDSYVVPLKGEFNVMNSMLCFAAAEASGMERSAIKSAFRTFSGVDGRFDIVVNAAPYTVIVDYAHTPDSLDKILDECRKVAGDNGKVVTVFGCTGDRDKEKRPLMGEVVYKKSDYSIITNDDTYGENEMDIISMILDGYTGAGAVEGVDYQVVTDRRSALETAMSKAKPGDVVLAAGMGHQIYQILGDRKNPWNDRQAILELHKKIHS